MEEKELVVMGIVLMQYKLQVLQQSAYVPKYLVRLDGRFCNTLGPWELGCL